MSFPPSLIRHSRTALILLTPILLLLAPYLFQGRVLLPAELMALFPPFRDHVGELWGRPPAVQNPLLDALQQYYPRRVYFTEAVREGWLPFWNPYVYGGSPFVGAQQGAIYYPPAWLLALAPPMHQFALSALLHLAVAAGGAWAFLRGQRLTAAAAATGALAFSLNGFVIVWLAYPNVTLWTLCWLPVTLWLWDRYHERPTPDRLAAAAAGLAMPVLGGHGQSSAYVLVAWGIWTLCRCSVGVGRGRAATPKPLGAMLHWTRRAAPPAALALGLGCAQLLPTFDFVPRTDRGHRLPWKQVYGAGMPTSQFATLLLPRLFGNGTLASAQQFWMPVGDREGLAYIERSFYPGAAVLVLAAASLAVLFPRGKRPEPACPRAETPGMTPPNRRRRRTAQSGREPEPALSPAPVAASDGGACRTLMLYGGIVTLLAFAWATTTPLYYPLWLAVPGFSQFTAVARVLCLAAWGLPCLAAVGVEQLTAGGESNQRHAATLLLPWALLLAVLTLVAQALGVPQVPAEIRAALNAVGAGTESGGAVELVRALGWILGPALITTLVLLRRPGGERYLRAGSAGALLAALTAADLLSFGAGFNPAADPALLSRTTPELELLQGVGRSARVLSVGPPERPLELSQRLPANLLSTSRIPDLLGSDSFVTLRYREWEAALLASLCPGARGPWSRPGAPNLRAAGVRYYLTGARRSLFPGMTPLAGPTVQEDPRAAPFARFHPRLEPCRTVEELLEKLGRADRDPLRPLVVGNLPAVQTRDGEVQPFSVLRPNGNRLVLEGVAPSEGLLVVAEQFEPGWRVRVDGRAVRPAPADHLFLGIPLGPGSHRVELRYEPAPCRVGQFVTLLALGCLAGLVVSVQRRRG
ncbi:MAG: YfhO family protein [Armatimonadetes bacterium]|nr:YfhO family protein [Armatimonadota bacterium]